MTLLFHNLLDTTRLEEVFELSDRITVLRDGHKIVILEAAQTNRKELINYMIDSELGEEYPDRKGTWQEEVLLEVKNFCGDGFRDINFKVHKGEILGISGLVGAKRTEIVRTIFGADRLWSGEILFEGRKPVTIKRPGDAIALGITMVPEDRKSQGVVLRLVLERRESAEGGRQQMAGGLEYKIMRPQVK